MNALVLLIFAEERTAVMSLERIYASARFISRVCEMKLTLIALFPFTGTYVIYFPNAPSKTSLESAESGHS